MYDTNQLKSAKRQMARKLGLPSAGALHRILKLPRTIIRLAEEDGLPERMPIQPAHLADGVSQRAGDVFEHVNEGPCAILVCMMSRQADKK